MCDINVITGHMIKSLLIQFDKTILILFPFYSMKSLKRLVAIDTNLF